MKIPMFLRMALFAIAMLLGGATSAWAQSKAELDWANEYYSKNCNTKTGAKITPFSWRDVWSVTTGHFFICDAARSIIAKDFHREDLRTALPTLLYIPPVLSCKTKAQNFTVTRKTGTGGTSQNPGSTTGTYSISFNKDESTESTSAHLLTHRHIKNEENAFGHFSINVNWGTLSLFLDKYDSKNGHHFKGTLQDGVRRTYTEIDCYSQDVKFEIDIKGSYY